MIVNADDLKQVYSEFKSLRLNSAIFLPLSNKKKPIGIMVVYSYQEKKFSKKELEVLQLFSPMASLAVRKMQLYDEIKKASKSRDLFISLASHELKTPLTTINGYIQLLKNRFAERGGVEAEWIEELSWEISRLMKLIMDLLEVNKIKSGQLQYHWKEISLVDIIDHTLSNFRIRHPEHKIRFQNNLKNNDYKIIGDFDKLLQVTLNLLDNSAKFSPPDKEILINLRYKQAHLILDISDYGKGIDKDDLPKVFDVFYKGKDNYRQGLGLGMFLAKNIIEKHHGFINIISNQKKGTKIEIQLPKAK